VVSLSSWLAWLGVKVNSNRGRFQGKGQKKRVKMPAQRGENADTKPRRRDKIISFSKKTKNGEKKFNRNTKSGIPRPKEKMSQQKHNIETNHKGSSPISLIYQKTTGRVRASAQNRTTEKNGHTTTGNVWTPRRNHKPAGLLLEKQTKRGN